MQVLDGEAGKWAVIMLQCSKSIVKFFHLSQASAFRVEEELKEQQREKAASLRRFQGEVKQRVNQQVRMRRKQQLQKSCEAVSIPLLPASQTSKANVFLYAGEKTTLQTLSQDLNKKKWENLWLQQALWLQIANPWVRLVWCIGSLWCQRCIKPFASLWKGR